MQSKNSIATDKWFIIIMTLMLVVRDLMDISINKYIFVAIVIAFCIFAKPIEIPVISCFLFPLLWGLPYTWFIAPIVIIYLFKKRRINTKALCLIAFFILAEILASIWYPSANVIDIIKYISVLSMFFVLLFEDDVDRKRCVNAFFAGIFLLCFVIFVKTIMTAPSNWLDLFVKGWFRFGMIQGDEGGEIALRVNTNTLAYYSSIGISFSLIGIDLYEQKRKVLAIVSFLFFTLVGFLTLSRSWILVVILCVFLFLMGRAKSVKSAIQTAFIGMIVIAVIILGSQLVPALREGVIARLQASDNSTGGGRTYLCREYFRIWVNNIRFFFLGTGVTQYKKVSGISQSMHNMFQQIIVSYGVVGSVVFLYGLFTPLLKRKTKRLILWLPMISVLLFVQTIQFINPEALMLPYVVALYTLRMEDNEEVYNHS